MNRTKPIGWLVGTLVIAAVVAVASVAVPSLGSQRPTRLAFPDLRPQAPQGCVSVAPAAYTSICPDRGDGAPAPGPAPVDCQPVAPGAYTSICDDGGDDAPDASGTPADPQVVCRPVAPGAYTEICVRR